MIDRSDDGLKQISWGERLDSWIAPFAPGLAASRQLARNRYLAERIVGDQVRQYEVAQTGRRTSGWHRPATSANAELQRGRALLAQSAHDLVRNNKYAASGVGQMVGMIWGDGIVPQFSHEDRLVAQLAQDEWDRWAESDVDGVGDWYGHGKLLVREMIVGGEAATLWGSDGSEPWNQVMGIEGPQIDPAKTIQLADGGRIVQGVEMAAGNRPRAYWLFPDHPHDTFFGRAAVSKRIDATRLDHVFERQRFGQARGASWLAAVAMTLRDVSDIEDAALMREKVQACLALVLTRRDGAESSPLSTQRPQDPDTGKNNLLERLSPGMIYHAREGESAQTIDPQPSANTVNLIKQQLAAISANMAPYHLMTGDVSQANYSSLRAANNGAYTRVDDWQQNEVIPLVCRKAVRRRMMVAALKHGDRRLLEVKTAYALPKRRMVDPIKDLAAEVMEMRSGLATLKTKLGERGINSEDHLRDIAEMNRQLDNLGIALDSDPRKVMGSGKLQDPVGYLGGGQNTAAEAG